MKKVVVNSEYKSVNLKDVDINKIYAFFDYGGIHKLQKINNYYQFVILSNSHNYLGHIDNSYIKVINDMIDFNIEVFEFDNFKEFLDWCQEVIKD